MAGSHSIAICRFLRSFHNIFHAGYTSLHSHQKYTSLSFSPHPNWCLLSFGFWLIAILTGVRQNLIVVFIFISLMANDHVHVFMSLVHLYFILRGKKKCLCVSLARI